MLRRYPQQGKMTSPVAYGDRAANNALWTIAMVRMRSDPRTRQYVERRTREGKSNKEIHRCLKRYLVRELYPYILADLADLRRAA